MINNIYNIKEFKPLQDIIERHVQECSSKLISKYNGHIEFTKHLCEMRYIGFSNDVGYLEVIIPRYVTDYRVHGDNFKLFKKCYELWSENNKLKL